MRIIDRIKDDLKKIFEPPTEDEQQMSVGLVFRTAAQRDFAARADQRIAALVEFYEAMTEMPGNYLRVREARAALEKEE